MDVDDTSGPSRGPVLLTASTEEFAGGRHACAGGALGAQRAREAARSRSSF